MLHNKSDISPRQPAVSGKFYPGDAATLRNTVTRLIVKSGTCDNAIGIVSPHAGYLYSGKVAGAIFAAIPPKRTYLILGPNHTGIGSTFSITERASWSTPLGEVIVNVDLAKDVVRRASNVSFDESAHLKEHSIETQLPFLQVSAGDFSILPIVIGQADLAAYRALGDAIAAALSKTGLEKEAIIIASSDMTHYEPQAQASKKDSSAIEAIIALDEEELFSRVTSQNITMCGYAPAIIMIVASKALGASRGSLIAYETSGDVTGDFSSVVGYAGIAVS